MTKRIIRFIFRSRLWPVIPQRVRWWLLDRERTIGEREYMRYLRKKWGRAL